LRNAGSLASDNGIQLFCRFCVMYIDKYMNFHLQPMAVHLERERWSFFSNILGVGVIKSVDATSIPKAVDNFEKEIWGDKFDELDDNDDVKGDALLGIDGLQEGTQGSSERLHTALTKGCFKGPIDYDKQCGVINNKNLPCL